LETSGKESISDSERKEAEKIEIEFNKEKYIISVDLTVSGQIEIQITRNVDPYFWYLVTDYEKLTSQERRWYRFLDAGEIFRFLVAELKSKNVRCDINNQKFKLILSVEVMRELKADLVLEANEKEADLKTVLGMLTSNVRRLLPLIDDEDQLLKKRKIFKIFQLTTGAVNYTPTNWTDFVGANGTVDLEKNTTYKWDLIINGQYSNGNNAMIRYRLALVNENDKAATLIPNEKGCAFCFSHGGYWGSNTRLCDIFTAPRTGTYNIQLQLQLPQGYNYQWNSEYGSATLIIESY